MKNYRQYILPQNFSHGKNIYDNIKAQYYIGLYNEKNTQNWISTYYYPVETMIIKCS